MTSTTTTINNTTYEIVTYISGDIRIIAYSSSDDSIGHVVELDSLPGHVQNHLITLLKDNQRD